MGEADRIVLPVLAPGERLLVLAELLRDPGLAEPLSVRDEVRNLFDPTVWIGLGSHPGNALRRLFFGRAVVGGAQSMARALYDVLDAHDSLSLAVTDVRLVLLRVAPATERKVTSRKFWSEPLDEVATFVHEVPRGVLGGAVMAPAGLLRRGRFMLNFVDGSSCALVGGLPSKGRRAVEAIGQPDGSGHRRPGGAA